VTTHAVLLIVGTVMAVSASIVLNDAGLAGWGGPPNDRERRKNRSRIMRRHPRIGRWILPGGWIVLLTGLVLDLWAFLPV
jgi:uncharacterized iron-regulated membrane protein